MAWGRCKNEYNVESTLLSLARTGQFKSGLRTGFPIAPSIVCRCSSD